MVIANIGPLWMAPTQLTFLIFPFQYIEVTMNLFVTYSDDSIKNTVLRPNRQYKASTAEMAEYQYS